MTLMDTLRLGRLLTAVLLVLVLLGCSDRGSAKGSADPPRRATGSGSDDALLIEVNPDDLSRVAVELGPATVVRLTPELRAYGRVLSPAPVVEAIANLAASRTAADAAIRALTRVKKLARNRENASEREVEAARAIAARAESDLEVADYRVNAVLGAARDELDDLEEFAHRLSLRRAALVRIDVPFGPTRPEPAHSSHLVAYPQISNELTVQFLGTAPDSAPQRPGWSFLFVATRPAADSRPDTELPQPGAPVRAKFAASGQELSGVHVPASALLRNEAKLFVLLSQGQGRFARREVTAHMLADGSAIVTRGVEEGASIVVTGAQQLLSAQQLHTLGSRGAD